VLLPLAHNAVVADDTSTSTFNRYIIGKVYCQLLEKPNSNEVTSIVFSTLTNLMCRRSNLTVIGRLDAVPRQWHYQVHARSIGALIEQTWHW
jgi:hypothetical protein